MQNASLRWRRYGAFDVILDVELAEYMDDTAVA